jgi:mono/diheme cytochrome c family protein
MSVKLINAILLVVLAVLVGTIFLVRRNYPTRNVEILPGMVSYVAYNAQSSNPNFGDGKTLQRPVEGTVVRGFAPLPYKATPEDAIRAGQELGNPLNSKDSTSDLERGAFVYTNICKPCHGAGGAGDGLIPQKGFPPPPSLLAENARKLPDEQMFHLITYGQRNMPALETQVTRKDRWRAVKYIRLLQQQQKNVTVR